MAHEIAQVTKILIQVRSQDTLVFTHPLRMSEESKAAAKTHLASLLPVGVKIIILDQGMQLAAVLTPEGGEKV